MHRTTHFRSRALWLVALTAIVSLVLLSPPSQTVSSYATAAGNKLFLPLVFRNFGGASLSGAGNDSQLGVWIGGGNANTVNLLQGSGAKWTRIYLQWNSVEPTYTVPATYDFSYYDSLFAALGSAGITPIAEIRRNPPWAATTSCGPIDQLGGQAAFARFVRATVSRYSQPPYNVKNWEFYNEADNTDMGMLGLFLGGCWGNYPNEYTAMLHLAHDTVKQVDPNARILIGGLAHENAAAFNLSFLDQVLAAGVGNYLDVMNVHYYSSFAPAWSPNGVDDIKGKIAAVRQTMAKYGVNKPIAVTETGWTSTPNGSSDLPEMQARYVPKVLSRGRSVDLYAILWFCLADWSGADYPYGLMDVIRYPRPVYNAFQEAAAEFGGATFVRPLSPGDVGIGSGVEGYVFNAGDQERWVLWVEGGQMWVTLPDRASSARDKLGQTIPLAGDGAPTSLLLGDSPIYVRF